MIISKKYGYIYIKCRKVAGSTTQTMLIHNLTDPKVDIICRGKKSDPNIRNCRAHTAPRGAKSIIGIKQYEEMLKIFNVRHPIDRMISEYYWQKARQKKFRFTDFSSWLRSSDCHGSNNFPRYDELLQDKKVFIVRFESLKEDIDKLFKTFNSKPPEKLRQINSGTREDNRHWSEIISNSDINYIKKMHSHEIKQSEFFGYFI